MVSLATVTAGTGIGLSDAILASCTEHSIVALDMDLKAIEWNEGAQRLFQYAPTEMIGNGHCTHIYDPVDLQGGKIQKILEEVRLSGAWSGELKCIKKDNSSVVVEVTITVRTDSMGTPIGYTMIAHDATEQHRKIQALTAADDYTRNLIESNLDALVTTDPLGVITDVNRRICEMIECTHEQLLGSLFKTHFSEPLHAEDLIRKVVCENRINNYELQLKSSNGKLTPVSFNAQTIRTADGHLKGIFASARDITEQKHLVEQSFAQSNDLLKATNFLNDVLKSTTTYSIIALDLAFNILIWNEGAKRNYGYSSEEMVGKSNLWKLHIPEDIESGRAKSMFEQTLKSGKFDGVFERVRKNGEHFPALISVTLRRDAEGNPVGFVLISKDITVQKEQEQELREQLSYSRSLFESSIDFLMATDTLGIINDVNKQMCAVTGYTLEEMIGTEFKNYFTDKKRAEDCILSVLTEEKVTNYELTLRARDGKETAISCNASIFKGTDGNLKGVFAVARDITEQKRLEGESREQNSQLKEVTGFLNNVLESSTAYSIIAEDLEGNILAWNEGARLNYGYSAEEMVGKQNTRILHAPEDIQSGRLQSVLDAALKTGKEEGILESVRKNGERFTASLALTLRKDANNNPVGYLLISKDITDQKREEVLVSKNVELEEQNRLVHEANRLKSDFLANMSHELRSPLNGIIGFAEVMYLGKVGPISAEHKEYLGDILTSSRHLLQLINDILDLAKVESGKMEFHPENVELKGVINEVCDILRTLTAKKRIQLSINVDPTISNVIIDASKLKQILYNYISNAIKFTKEDGIVDIRVIPEGTECFRLEVEDNGIGIREEDIPRLFTEFQQLDGSLNKKYQGTGLGLALVRRIADAQGGQVGVTSTIDKGSTFFIILPKVPLKLTQVLPAISESLPEKAAQMPIPVIQAAVKPIERRSSETVISDKLLLNESTKSENTMPEDNPVLAKATATVLVIEDDPKDSQLVTKTLIDEGYTVETAFTGSEAINLCQTKQYDVITVDLLLPDMNGWDVLRAFRSKGLNLETPAIVVTVVASKAASFGFMIQNFLVKPLNASDLVTSLQRSGIYPNENKTILFIDNDPHMLLLCQQYLKDYGATVLCVTTAEEGLIEATLKRPDVIILDLLMPQIDGLEFLRRFRITEYGKKTPVIICTSQDITDVDRSRIKASVTAVIQKGGESMSSLAAEMKRICPLLPKKNSE